MSSLGLEPSGARARAHTAFPRTYVPPAQYWGRTASVLGYQEARIAELGTHGCVCPRGVASRGWSRGLLSVFLEF